MNRNRGRVNEAMSSFFIAACLGALVAALMMTFPFTAAAAGKKKKSKGPEYTCDIESVQKAVEKAGEKGIMKALEAKEHIKNTPAFAIDTSGGESPSYSMNLKLKSWKAGYFTQAECAEVMILYTYEYEKEIQEINEAHDIEKYIPSLGPYVDDESDYCEIAVLGMKGKKLKKKKNLKNIGTAGTTCELPILIDIQADGIDEAIIFSKKGNLEYSPALGSIITEPLVITTMHLIGLKGGKPLEYFKLEASRDDTLFRLFGDLYEGYYGDDVEANPPYTEHTSSPVFIDLDGDTIKEITVSSAISKYSDIGHKKLISKKDEPIKTYFFNGKVFEPGKGTAMQTNTPDIKDAAKTAYNEGQSKFEVGDYPGALAGFKKALDILPNAFVYIKIAGCYEKMQDYKEAANWLQKYVQEKPGSGSIADIQSRIKKLIADQPQADAGIHPVKNSTATFPGVLFGKWSIQALDDEAGGGSGAVDLSQSIAFNPAGEAVLTVAFEDMDTGEEETSVTKRKWTFKSGAVHIDDMKCSILDKKPKKMTADAVDGTCAFFVVSENEILWWHEEAGPVRMVLEKLARQK